MNTHSSVKYRSNPAKENHLRHIEGESGAHGIRFKLKNSLPINNSYIYPTTPMPKKKENKIKIIKVIPDKVGFGLLHKVKISFPRTYLRKTKKVFLDIFPNRKVVIKENYHVYTARVKGCNSPISLAWRNCVFNQPYLTFDGSCSESTSLIQFLLYTCVGFDFNKLACISELETRMDIYPTNDSEWKSIQDIFKTNLTIPYSRNQKPKQYLTTYYSNTRGATRSVRIYPRPTTGDFNHLRVEVIFRRPYIRHKKWQINQLGSLRDSIDLFSQLNYRKSLGRRQSFRVGLNLAKNVKGLPFSKESMGVWILGDVFSERICPYHINSHKPPLIFQMERYKEICKKRGIRSRPERVFPRYPKTESIRRDLENGFLRRSYED